MVQSITPTVGGGFPVGVIQGSEPCRDKNENFVQISLWTFEQTLGSVITGSLSSIYLSPEIIGKNVS